MKSDGKTIKFWGEFGSSGQNVDPVDNVPFPICPLSQNESNIGVTIEFEQRCLGRSPRFGERSKIAIEVIALEPTSIARPDANPIGTDMVSTANNLENSSSGQSDEEKQDDKAQDR